MAAAKDKPTASPDASQTHARGYLIGEDAAYAMQEIAAAMSLVGELFDIANHTLPEMNGGNYAALFRTFARQVDHIRQQADFTFDAKIAPRDLH